jgi:uncharacterized membrane protein
MGHVSIRIHIDAPVEHVWDTAADCSRIVDWNVTFVEVRECQGRIDHVGARYSAVSRILGRNFSGDWETTRVERPGLIETRGTTPGGGHATVITTMQEADGGTDVGIELEHQLPGGVFGDVLERLAGGAVERDLRTSSENFKALCEATKQ